MCSGPCRGCRRAQQNRVLYSPLARQRVYLTPTFARVHYEPVTRLREPASERALGYVRKSILRRRGTLSGPSSLLVGRYEGAVKKCAPPSRRPGKKRGPGERGEGGIRDKAQKRCPGKTGGRKSRPLIGKSKFVLRKLSAGGRCERTRERETTDAA